MIKCCVFTEQTREELPDYVWLPAVPRKGDVLDIQYGWDIDEVVWVPDENYVKLKVSC